MKKDKIGKSLLIEFLSNLTSQTFFGLILYFNMLKGELRSEANKETISNKIIMILKKKYNYQSQHS